MPVHNGERYLAQAIESVLNQSFTNFEMLIVNDGSNDSTAAILEEYAYRDKRIRILTNKAAQGYGGEKASNGAYKLAKGQYVAKLDADDVARPDRLAKQVAFLNNNPTIFLVGSFLEIIDTNGKVTSSREYPTGHQDIYQSFYYRNPIGHPSIMFRNGLIKGDFYQLRFPALNDYYSFFRLIQAGYPMANIPEYLVQYRIHDSNTVFTDLRRKWKINMSIKRSFIDDYKFRPSFVDKLLLSIITLTVNSLPEKFLVSVMNQARKILKA
ncbi:MAG: glycosyltransferase [Cytophagales bacterium]|nr:MAG: glycosyltransferase [Cytophagales bacterium]